MSKPNDNQGLSMSEAQSKSYINWINSHLKKRPGVKLVENLQNDVCNGVVFIHLIEVLSGHVFPDVNLNPKTLNDSRDNIEKIFKFMHINSIKMHKTPAKEIYEGNLKSIMRLVLALAAHFKPSNLISATSGQALRPSSTTSSLGTASNKYQLGSNRNFAQSTNNLMLNNNQLLHTHDDNQQNPKPGLNQTRIVDSMTQLVQSACVNIADVRKYRNENFNVKYVKYVNLQANPGLTQPTSLKNDSNKPNHISTNITSQVNHINNKTYVTSNGSKQIPVTKSLQPKDDYSFSNMTILSPSRQIPLASSTLIQSHFSNDFNKEDEKIETNPRKNQTHIIEEVKTENNNFKIPVIPCVKLDLTNEVQQPQECIPIILTQSYINKESQNNEVTAKQNTTISLKKEQIQNENLNCNRNNPSKEEVNPLIDDEVFNNVQDVKHILLALQTMFMSGNLNEFMSELNGDLKQKSDEMNKNENNESVFQNGEANTSNTSNPDEDPLSNLTNEEQIAIYRSKIQQLEILSSDLRNELNQFKSEHMHKVGVQSGLKSRVNEQDKTILDMKNEQLNLHLNNQHLLKEIDEFKSKYEDCLSQTKNLCKELTIREEQIERLKTEINELIKEKEENVFLNKMKNYTDSMESVNDKENIVAGLVRDRKHNENNRQLFKKDATFVVNKAKTGSRPGSSNLMITFEESHVIKEALNRLRNSMMPNHPSLNLIDDLDFYLKNIFERSKPLSNSLMGQIPVNTGIATLSSNSSSLTSSSSNSPVQMQSAIEKSPINAKSSSSSNLFSSTNSNTVPNRILHHSAHFERQPLLLNNINNFKRSSESIFSQVGNIKTIQSNFSNVIRSPNSKNHEPTTTLLNEQITTPIVNNVKKIVSQFDAQYQNSTNNFQRTIKKSEDEKFLNPSTILKISKCLQQQQNQPQTPCSSSLLTISSSTSSSTTVSSSHSPSSIPQSSTSSSSSISSNIGNSSTTKCVYYIDKDPTPYMITINKS